MRVAGEEIELRRGADALNASSFGTPFCNRASRPCNFCDADRPCHLGLRSIAPDSPDACPSWLDGSDVSIARSSRPEVGAGSRHPGVPEWRRGSIWTLGMSCSLPIEIASPSQPDEEVIWSGRNGNIFQMGLKPNRSNYPSRARRVFCWKTFAGSDTRHRPIFGPENRSRRGRDRVAVFPLFFGLS